METSSLSHTWEESEWNLVVRVCAEEAVRGGDWASESGGHEVEVESASGWGKRISV